MSKPIGVVHTHVPEPAPSQDIAPVVWMEACPKQKLDLFEVTAGFPAELRTSPPQIVRRQLSEVGRLGIAHHQPPDCLLIADLRPGELAGFTDRPEEAVSVDPGSFEPGIDAGL